MAGKVAPKAPVEQVESQQVQTPIQTAEPETAPVYDERGNVRPRGTEGARPMTYAERVAIAERLNP